MSILYRGEAPWPTSSYTVKTTVVCRPRVTRPSATSRARVSSTALEALSSRWRLLIKPLGVTTVRGSREMKSPGRMPRASVSALDQVISSTTICRLRSSRFSAVMSPHTWLLVCTDCTVPVYTLPSRV